MKKLLILAFLCVLGLGLKAQNYPVNSAALIKGPTTLTNAAADTTSFTISGAKPTITIKYDIAKTSGTVAGTIVLQGKITAASSAEQWTTINTYNLTDATATNSVALTSNGYLNYRVITTTTGTQVSVHRKYLLYRSY